MAWALDPDLLSPRHTNDGGARVFDDVVEPVELTTCPGGGTLLDLRSGERLTRYWRLSTAREGVGRTRAVRNLSAP